MFYSLCYRENRFYFVQGCVLFCVVHGDINTWYVVLGIFWFGTRWSLHPCFLTSYGCSLVVLVLLFIDLPGSRKQYEYLVVVVRIILVCYTYYSSIYKALRSAGDLRRPLHSLWKKEYIALREADRRSMIEHIFL